MRKFKKNIAYISATIMCLSCTAINISADEELSNDSVTSVNATYKQGDVNGDGSVDATDLLALKRFLLSIVGTSDGSTAERLDVYRDGVIDSLDIETLSNIILGLSSSATRSYLNTTALPSQSAKTYYQYNASTGAQISSYTLGVLDEISTSSDVASTYSIIGDDERVVDYSKSGVVKLNYNIGSSGYVASGFVIGKHTILTAAHCVYYTETDTPVTDMKYTLYNSDGTEIGTYSASSYHVPKEYQDASSYETTGFYYDYAIIEVEQDLSDYMIFDIGVPRSYITTVNPKLYVTGYSANDKQYEMVTGYGYLTSPYISNYNIVYNVDMVGGESGGPVYFEDSSGKLVVIGINSGENGSVYNVAKRIDIDVLHFINYLI